MKSAKKAGGKKSLRWYRVQEVSLVPPPQRSIVIALWHDQEGDQVHFWHSYLPVLAIETVVRHAYERPVGEGQLVPQLRTHREFLQDGWRYRGQEVVRGPVVSHFCEWDEVVNVEADDWNYHHPLGGNCHHRLVVCDWPASEDEERLRPLLDELKEQARLELGLAPEKVAPLEPADKEAR